MTISIVVADDQALIRAGLVMLLATQPDLDVVAEAADGAEAVRLAREVHPDVVLMDVRMPVMDGVAATRQIAADVPAPGRLGLTKVLILTTFNDDEAVLGALRAGASGFLLKHAAPTELVAAVRSVASGEAWLDPSVAGQVITALAQSADGPAGPPTPQELADRLTRRELEVLTLMAQGLSNGEIRDRLVLSEATVKTHVARVIMKTGSRDRTAAVVLAYRSGLVLPPPRPPHAGQRGG